MRYRIRGEGCWQGPVGPEAGPWLALWIEANLQLELARAAGDPFRVELFRGLAVAALVRTLRGRGN